MKKVFPLTRDNIQMVANMTNIPVDALWDQLNHAKADQIREGKIESACNFFGKDRLWYDTTIEMVCEIEKSLPEGMTNKERIVKMWGWIETAEGTRDLRVPCLTDDSYAHAFAVKAILTNYDSYIKMMNWD